MRGGREKEMGDLKKEQHKHTLGGTHHRRGNAGGGTGALIGVGDPCLVSRWTGGAFLPPHPSIHCLLFF